MMDDKKVRICPNANFSKRNIFPATLNPAFDFLVQIPQRLHNRLKTHLKHLGKHDWKFGVTRPMTLEQEPSTVLEIGLDKQLQAWKANSKWIDQPPEIKVSVPKGSLCNLNVIFKVGLPPDAIYNIVIDPENKRVFKNIKEVISRRVLVDEGQRQVVEVEQAAIWRFLWWSGTISVHVIVDQNRKDHTVKFKQGKSGFMERFEGCWRVEPLFIDEQYCLPHKPKTLSDYESCTEGKGRVGSIVTLDQLIQPALVPPPPISWYLRGITTKTTEMLINDLRAEAARLTGAVVGSDTYSSRQELGGVYDTSDAHILPVYDAGGDVKERWRLRRRSRRKSSCRAFASMMFKS